MEFSLTFLKVFLLALYLMLPLFVFLSAPIIILGQIVGYKEKWRKGEALYWSFITATTVGYGDVRPTKKTSRVLAVFIAMLGLMFTGLLVAVTLKAANVAFEKNVMTDSLLNKIEKEFK